jgi:hypothetical protein
LGLHGFGPFCVLHCGWRRLRLSLYRQPSALGIT